MNFLLREQ